MKKTLALVAPTLLGLALSSHTEISNLVGNAPISVTDKVVNAATTAPTTDVEFTPDYDHVRALVFYAINHLRAENGLKPLVYNQQITNAWSQTIVDRNADAGTLNHNMSDERAAMHSINYYFFGENLAMTPISVPIRSGDATLNPIESDEDLAIGLVTQYYDDVNVSDYGHRKNLLDPYFTQVGIAFTQRTDSSGVTRVYNSLDFAGVATTQTNAAINNYVSYSVSPGLDNTDWPSVYQPLNSATIDSQSGEYGIVNYVADQGINLWNGYEDRIFTGRTLPNGSAWKILDAKADTNGHLWYEVGNDQWIDSSYVQVYSW